MKIQKVENAHDRWMFYCQACECAHYISSSWTFNGDCERPTISPSIKVSGYNNDGKFICHFFIKKGRLEYCKDCTHKLAGKTVEMEEI